VQIIHRIIALTIKELLAILKDPKSRFVVIGPPFIQFFIYGYAATFDVTNVPYAVFDEDRTPASRALLAEFVGSDNFRLVQSVDSEADIAPLINNETVRLVLHLPQQFGAELATGRPSQLQIIVDGRNSNVASIAAGYANAIVAGFNARQAGHAQIVGNGTGALQLVDRAWYNPNLVSRWFITSALGGVICTVVVMILSSLSVAREREFGTFDQLLVSPLSPTEILIAKSVPAFVFGLGDSLLLSAAAVWWFGVPFEGSVAALVAILAMYIISIVGVGLFVSSLSTTMQQGLLGSFVVIMPMIILAGFTTPIQNMPNWLQHLTLVNPLRYATAGLRRIFLEGAAMSDILSLIWPLAVIGVVNMILAGVLFRHRAA
jgi:ABC-2 type transport system permease protein